MKCKNEQIIKRFKEKEIIVLMTSDEDPNFSNDVNKLAQEIKNKNPDFIIISFDDLIIKLINEIKDECNLFLNRNDIDLYLNLRKAINQTEGEYWEVNKIIEKYYFSQKLIITNVRFNDQFSFFFNAEAFIVKTRCLVGYTLTDSSTLKNQKYNLKVDVAKSINPLTINSILTECDNYYFKKRNNKKTLKGLFKEEKPKRKRITKKQS